MQNQSLKMTEITPILKYAVLQNYTHLQACSKVLRWSTERPKNLQHYVLKKRNKTQQQNITIHPCVCTHTVSHYAC